jgi:nucleoside-diphosphate-sugar epimerase
MRIFVAGATGAIGSRLVPMLAQNGHEVIGTTRSATKAREVRDLGAEPAVVDGLDRDGVLDAVTRAKPDVIIHELTAISGPFDLKHFDRFFAATNRLRVEGTDNLLAAAHEAGVRRFVAQSYTGWPNARTGGPVKTEDDPLVSEPGKDATQSLAAIRHVESAVTSAAYVQGLVLRYGSFYGPGNAVGKGGEIIDMLRKRRFPIVGGGTGIWSFIHIDDAARATMRAAEGGPEGIYNIVDDDPAPVHEWLPYLAQAVGAKPPMRVPAWLARLLIGQFGVDQMTRMRGSSNAKARRELGWAPRFTSWRQGFKSGLG